MNPSQRLEDSELRTIVSIRPSCEAYLFTWVPTWPVERVEITIVRDGQEIEMICKKIRMTTDGDRSKTHSRLLSKEQWHEFESLLEEAMFWEIPITHSATGLDGHMWLLAGYRNGSFRNVYRWCGGTLERAGTFLAELAEVELRASYMPDETADV
jgi:hypothetical protein